MNHDRARVRDPQAQHPGSPGQDHPPGVGVAGLQECHARAEAISLGAIKFFMLKTDAIRDLIFNPEESISFEGETGPYVQYAHARACSILRKAGKIRTHLQYSLLQQSQEQALCKMLLAFPITISDTASHCKPHVLCRYLLDLAQLFNEYYHAVPVISENEDLMAARLSLVDAVRQVIENGLTLLGITALKEM